MYDTAEYAVFLEEEEKIKETEKTRERTYDLTWMEMVRRELATLRREWAPLLPLANGASNGNTEDNGCAISKKEFQTKKSVAWKRNVRPSFCLLPENATEHAIQTILYQPAAKNQRGVPWFPPCVSDAADKDTSMHTRAKRARLFVCVYGGFLSSVFGVF